MQNYGKIQLYSNIHSTVINYKLPVPSAVWYLFWNRLYFLHW